MKTNGMYNTDQPTINVNIALRQLKKAFALIFILNFFVLFGTWFHKIGLLKNSNNGLRRLVAHFDLGTGNNIAAWYSGMLLLLVAVQPSFVFCTIRAET